jgi:LigXa C-terminal domain like
VSLAWETGAVRRNDYLIDRLEQKYKSFTGIKGVSEQDACIQDSQGFIADRTREHLGPTDFGIVRFRRVMLDSARNLPDGQPPRAASKPDGISGACRRDGCTFVEAARGGDDRALRRPRRPRA